MKQGIHPEYRPVAFQDASTGKLFVTRSTATSERTVDVDGVSYPLIVVDGVPRNGNAYLPNSVG